jgi:hypothetical protein
MEIYLIILILFAFSMAAISAWVGSQREAGTAGFILGLLLGPIGILITAIALDGRQKCPYCLEHVNLKAQLCPKCHSELHWAFEYDEDELRPGRWKVLA